MKLNKIKDKLFLVLLAFFLIPTLILGILVIVSGSKTLRQASLETQSVRLEQDIGRIQDYLDQVDNDLFYLSETNALKLYFSVLQSDSAVKQRLMLTNLRNSFKKFLRQKSQYLQISFIDSGGMEIVRVENIDGKVKNISDAALHSKREMPFFKHAMGLKKGDLFMSELNLNGQNPDVANSLQSTIYYVTPVFDRQNNTQGILVGHVNMNRILQKAASQLPNGMQIMLIDSDGNYLFHSDRQKVNAGEKSLDTRTSFFSDKNITKEQFNSSSTVKHQNIGDEIISYTNLKINNKRQLGTFIIVAPKDLVFQSSDIFIRVLIIVMILMLVLGVIFAYLMASRVSKPLVLFSDDVERLSKGELEKRIIAASNDEIGALAISVERLRKSTKILMKKAAQ